MAIREELNDKYQAFRETQKDTPNSKPNRIVLSQEAYDEMISTSNMRDMPNPTMTYDDVQLVCDPDQEQKIKFEKRRFHS